MNKFWKVRAGFIGHRGNVPLLRQAGALIVTPLVPIYDLFPIP